MPYFFDIIAYKTITSEELKEHIRIYGKTIMGGSKNIPNGWREVRLGEEVTTNDNSIGQDFNYTELEYLDTGSITVNKIENYQIFKVDEAPSRAKRLIQDCDIIYSTVRPNQKHYGFITKPNRNTVVSTGFTVIRTKESNCSKFIYYWLIQNSVTTYLQQLAEQSTSAYPSIKPIDIENLLISLPKNIEEQKAIAEILSSLDDKIDLLHRQNKTLENIAQTIFKEWFGKQKNEDFENSENILEFEKGVEVGSKNYFEDKKVLKSPIKFYRVGDIAYNGKQANIFTEEKFLKNKTFGKKDVLISFDGTVGRVFVDGTGGYSTGIRKVYSKEKFNYIKNSFVYFWGKSKNIQDTIKLYSEGTTIQHAGKSIKYLKIISDKESILEVQNHLTPIFEKILSNLEQIQILTKTRDVLLPKLMSGKIRVKNYE